MHPDLSRHLHSPECNTLIDALKKCHEEHKFKKFLGYCNEIDSAMVRCLRKERKDRQRANFEKSVAKRSQIEEAKRLAAQPSS